MKKRTDFLVLGSGIAGLTFALKASKYGKVTVITKSKLDDTNTKYAQGGIASVFREPDNFEKHISDTLIAGAGICDEAVVRMVVREAPERIKDLIELGVTFDKKEDGTYDLAREGGHSESRILHHKDRTGEAIEQTLIDRARKDPNIEIFEHHFAIEILTQHHLGETVKRVVIPEMNLGQVAGEVRKYCRCDVIPIGQVNGEIIPPERIEETLRRVRS